MKHKLPPFKNLLMIPKYHGKARVVNGRLIASFPDAHPPCLWQQDVSEIQAAVIAKKEKYWSLGITAIKSEKSPKDIARFSDSESADFALRLIARALIRQPLTSSVSSWKFPSWLGKVFKWTIILLVIFFVIRLLFGSPAIQQAQMPSGLPVTADQILSLPNDL